ncbi:MAG: hypothetical protein KF893_25685, partial [Caldilineaceae bacterium]|nr:hypothetical protein [Caldilineaceae bacterium]
MMPPRQSRSLFLLVLFFLFTAFMGQSAFANHLNSLAQGNLESIDAQPDQLGAALRHLRHAQEAEQIVQRAWLLAQESGAYDFRTEIEQTTYHAPALTNVGRPAHVESLYLEGKTDTRAKEFELAMWQGSSILHRDQAYEVRTEGEQTYGRPAGDAWMPMDDVTSVFAPGRDALAYLHGIRNVREVPLEDSAVMSSLAGNFRQFRFEMDGPAFAEYMRHQLENELRSVGKLPAGITLDTPHIYRGVIGQGDIWLTSEGLPKQLHLNIQFPQSTDGSRVRAAIQTNFANFDTEQLARLEAPFGADLGGTPLWLANGISRLTLLDWSAVGMQVGFLAVLACLVLWMMRFRRRPQFIVVLNLTIMVTMVVAPLLQNSQVAAFQDEQAVAQQAHEAAQDEQAVAQQAHEAAQAEQHVAEAAGWNPAQSPLEVAEAAAALEGTLALSPMNITNALAAQSPSASTADSDGDGVPDSLEPAHCVGLTDCDGDGLTDQPESRVGTRLDNLDSDGDKLRDDLEVKGFLVGSQRWYSDPRNVDTNGDGFPDTLECWNENTAPDLSGPSNQACDKDSDGDGVPDLFTFDNDGDGVDDSVDLSPFRVTPASAPYNNGNPFALQSNNLTPNEPLFVDMQLVPTTRNQIAYARNVLDWPKNDTKGQVVRTVDTTFATGLPANSYPASEENGDLRLIPLVEIKMAATDAAKILPVTSTFSVTRQGVGIQSSQTWLKASVTFQAAEGTTTVAFTNLTDKDGAAVALDKVRIVASACPTSGSDLASVTERAATNQGEEWTLTQTALTDLMDGNHALLLQKGSNTLCLPLGDLPDGGLASGQTFDSAWLNAYGISLRDVVDGSGQTTHVSAYLPANVVTGQTGGEKQAFGVRMAYWPGAGVTSLGAAHQVRLVWMVQLLADDGSTQIVHVYPNEAWQMAGLSARQDIEMHSAVIYQEPDAPENGDADMRAIHGRLWSAIWMLDTDFARGGDNRLLLDENLISRLQSRTAAPAGSLGAVLTTYQTQDELARVPGEVTPDILARFVRDGVYKPGYDHALLLFARQEEYKAALWDGGNTLTLPAASSTLASYSWKPFRYVGGQWEAFPATAYLDLLSVRLKDAALQADFVQSTSDLMQRNAIRDGIALVNQTFAMSMLYGANRMVAVDNSPVPAPAQENELADTLGTINEKIVGATLQIIAGEIAEDLSDSLIGAAATQRIVDNFEFVSDEVMTAVNQRTKLTILGEVAQGRFDNFRAAFGKADLSTRVAAAGLAISVVSIGLVIGKIASSNSTLSAAMDVSMPALGVVAGTLTVASETNKVYSAVKGAGGLTSAIKSAQPLGRAAKIAAVVGLVLSAAIAVGVFVTQWVAGAFSITDLGFTAALSGVIAAIIVAVILLAISAIPIVGPIIVAVIALIDGLIAAACAITKKAGFDLEEATTLNIPRTGGAKLSLCAGITGLATEAVRFLLFSQTVLVGNMQAQDRLTTSNFDLNFTDKEAGFQVGNDFKPSLRVDNKITLPDQPFDWKSLVYFWQFNWDNLDSATHRYDLATDKSDRAVSRGEMEGEWRELNADGSLTASHRSPGIHYDDPLVMVSAVANLSSAETSVPLTQTGINVAVPLYLREAYANPAQECWTIPAPGFPITPIPICFIRSDKGVNHIDLQLTYDIFPATLDAFYTPAAVGGGVSLAWGQEGEVSFPAMRDFDGDGLLSPAVGGNDPDDRSWDTDGDGLSDLFETQKGTLPGAADSDQDGLSDRMEQLIGTDPLRRDSDGDGLLDGEEVFHQDVNGNRAGGWEFVYDIVDGVAQSTWVTSDPLSGNTDRDTFSDYQERLYGLNPRAISDPTILKLKSQLTQADAPGVLLRFEERTGATIFADSSGLGNHASCSGDACPQAGHEGRFTNGLLFDGVDDGIRMAEAVPLGSGSFTLAVSARRNAIGRPDLLFNTRETGRNEQMWMGFGATDQFACGFTADSVLNSPAYTDTDWHHWACTYDLTLPMVTGEIGTVTATLYRDGEVVDQRTFSRAFGYTGSGDWLIGGSYDQSGNLNSFGGALDEFVAIPAALTQEQIRLLLRAQYNTGSDRLLVAPGNRLAYAADLENNLLGRTLTGLLSVDAPTGWTNNDNLATYQLSPAQAKALSGHLRVGESAASGAYSVTVTAGADARLPDAPAASVPSAPDVYFSFDNAQNLLIDASGRQAATRVGGGNATPGVGVGNGLQLNGATLINTTDDPIFDLSGTSFTWSVWVKPDAGAGNTRAIFGQPPAGRVWQDTNGGVHLRVQNDRDLIFGWGDAWTTGPIPNVLTPDSWNHVVVTFDGNTLIVYVNGVQRNLSTPNSRPVARSRLTIGDDNYCGEFELKNVHTKKEGDPGEASAEYVYRFEDDQGNRDTLLNDENADTGEWEPGSGPSNNEWFTDKKRTFCFTGSRVYVYEDDGALGSDDSMSPDVRFDIATPHKVGYNNSNYESFWSPDISGDGTVEFYYEIRNPVLPFKGSMDELRLYRRALSEKEVQQLFQVAAVPYHYTLDDPPGSGLDETFGPGFKFVNEGAVADPRVQGACSGSCPTSGLPGRVNRAVSFGDIASDGMQVGQGIRIENLSLPQAAPGFSLWVKPEALGVFLSIYRDGNTLIGSSLYDPQGRFCLAVGSATACSASPYPTAAWTHVMINFSGNTMTLHLNNSEQVSVQTSGPAWPGAGAYSVSLAGTNFRGLLDDLRIPYNGGNVAAMLATAPLVSLHLDEEGAEITQWENVGGVSATCSGSTCPDAGRRGKVAQAAAFDGVDDGLLLPDSNALDLDNFTLAVWVSPASSPKSNIWETIVAKSEGDYRNYALYLTSDRQIVATRNCQGGSLIQVISNSALPDDQFTHVAATYDGRYMALYINGVFEKNVELASSASCHNDAPLAVGVPHNANASYYLHFNGLLDEVLVYPNALFDYEIGDLYAAQANWIEEKNGHTVFVDADLPASSLAETLPLATNYYPNADMQLGVNAADASSAIILLELGVSANGGPVRWTAAEPCQDAAQRDGSPAWCPWFLPSQWGGEGRYTLQTRATDAVGHRENPTASHAIVVDSTGPSLTVNQTDGSLLSLVAHPQIETAQILRLDGTASDPAIGADGGSGVAQVWVTLRDAEGIVVGDAPYPATINGGNWSLAYPFRQAQVAGDYTLEVWGEDVQGNRTTLPTRALALDGAAPGMILSEAASGLPSRAEEFRFITNTTTLTGWLGDQPLPPGARYAYRFEESPDLASSQRITFENLLATSGAESAAWCSDANSDCPTLGATGKDGRGLSFDGLYDYLTLPQDVAQTRDFTFAAWVYLGGPFPDQEQPLFFAGKDWENYLYFTPVGVFGGPEFFITQNGGQSYESLRTNTPLPAEQWTHLAFSLAGGVGRIYVNGAEQIGSVWVNGVDQGNNRLTLSPQDVAGEDNWIGRSKSTGDGSSFGGFRGTLDQVVIYHRGLGRDEVRVLAADRAAGVASGAVSFTPLWTAAQSRLASPHFSPDLPGQTLYLPLDEISHPISSTTTLYRNLAGGNGASANGQQPACTGDHCPQPAGNSPVGAAISFDGQDDFIQLPAEIIQGDNLTFAAWVYWRGGQSSQRIFSFGRDGFNAAELWTIGSELYFSMNTQGNRESLTALTGLPTNRWVHVAVTVEGASARLYLDGAEQGAKNDFAGRLSQIAGEQNLLGNSNSGLTYYFNGLMSDVRVFSQTISVWDNKGLRLGNRPLLSLPLDERLAVNGSPLTDDSGWGWDATLHSGPDDTANKAAPGHQGRGALTFDGVDDYVQLSTELGNDLTGSNAAFTFASWVYWRGGRGSLFSLGQDAGTFSSLEISENGLGYEALFYMSSSRVMA